MENSVWEIFTMLSKNFDSSNSLQVVMNNNERQSFMANY